MLLVSGWSFSQLVLLRNRELSAIRCLKMMIVDKLLKLELVVSLYALYDRTGRMLPAQEDNIIFLLE